MRLSLWSVACKPVLNNIDLNGTIVILKALYTYFTEIKEKLLYWLEKEESAFDRLDDLWRDKVDTTGLTTVRELFERYETKKGPLTQDELKDLLTDLAYVHITRHVFPQTRATSSTPYTGKL